MRRCPSSRSTCLSPRSEEPDIGRDHTTCYQRYRPWSRRCQASSAIQCCVLPRNHSLLDATIVSLRPSVLVLSPGTGPGWPPHGPGTPLCTSTGTSSARPLTSPRPVDHLFGPVFARSSAGTATIAFPPPQPSTDLSSRPLRRPRPRPQQQRVLTEPIGLFELSAPPTMATSTACAVSSCRCSAVSALAGGSL